MKRSIIVGIVIASMGVCFWQCTDENDRAASLKEALNVSTYRLNKALANIERSSGYRILLADMQNSFKSTSSYTTAYLDSILLEDIRGIYEYNRPDSMFFCHYGFYRLFERTGESDYLVVKLPESRLFHPRRLRDPLDQEADEQNNFVITASAYHYYFAHGFIHDYGLVAGFEQDNIELGTLAIQSTRKAWDDGYFSSSYSFPEGYSIDVEQSSGDTSTFSLALLQGQDILLKESVQSVKLENHRHRERTYTLIIGNVMMKRFAPDSLEIYLNGALQPGAKVEIIDNTDAEGDEMHSVCHRRDIQITFEDGTTTTVSELLGPSKEILSGLVDSIRNMGFATRVVDYIAWNIYWGNKVE